VVTYIYLHLYFIATIFLTLQLRHGSQLPPLIKSIHECINGDNYTHATVVSSKSSFGKTTVDFLKDVVPKATTDMTVALVNIGLDRTEATITRSVKCVGYIEEDTLFARSVGKGEVLFFRDKTLSSLGESTRLLLRSEGEEGFPLFAMFYVIQ
jgi:hypothetical protein